MIQLNLLPDVKQEYIKAARSRRLVTSIAIIVSVASIALLVFLFSFSALQKKNIGDLTDDIKKNTKALQKTPQIDRILTVQNQLNSLTGLHDQKPAASRLFGFLNQVTPTQIDITSLSVDFTTQTVTVTGSADALSSVNKFADTLKFTKYTLDSTTADTNAFTNVVLGSFGLGATGTSNKHPANYTITFSYDPNIFDITKKVSLSVPSITTTRSSVDQPNADLFQPSKTPPVNSGSGN